MKKIWLQKQENRIVIEIKFKNKTWIKKTVTHLYPQNLNPNLRADFNLDFRIDATDLTLLSKKLDKPANLYTIDSLYDLNQDGSINLYDYAIFQDYFG